MAYITAQELLQKIKQSNMFDEEGAIKVDFCSLDVQVRAKSAVGDLFQEWLGSWMERELVDFRLNTNTQEFPDYYLHETSDIQDLLEIKVFDHDAGAAFDVANFDTYTRSLLTQPHKLNANYLIFSYTLRNGVFSIENVWLKKIWEITGPMTTRPLNMQVKQNIFVNIRPVKWYSNNARFKPFGNKDDFLIALDSAIQLNNKETDWDKNTWLNVVKDGSIDF